MAKASRGLLGYYGHAAAAGLALGFVLLASHGAQAQDVPKVELRPGVFFEVVELKRVRKDISGLTFEIDNTSPDTVTLAQLGISDNERRVTDLKLIDFDNGKDYWIGDSGGACLCTTFQDGGPVEPGQKRRFWAWFGAPPAGVDKVAVFVPGSPPIFDVPLAK
ncbi:MAG: hypothetical protein U1E45_18615 [Geminicoccaceae bacterium]